MSGAEIFGAHHEQASQPDSAPAGNVANVYMINRRIGEALGIDISKASSVTITLSAGAPVVEVRWLLVNSKAYPLAKELTRYRLVEIDEGGGA